MTGLDRRLCVAPMLDWTDRHCRFFHRLITPRAVLYTEMVTTGALLHGDRQRFLGHDTAEHPLALQLGGSEPGELAACAALAEEAGFAEVNLNCGCPSERVQRGSFGACLMREPALVARCVAAMIRATSLPVTVKCRIGVDDVEDMPFLLAFVDEVAAAGCSTFIVHARKAWLKGLSPKENRDLPPLRYELVHALKERAPELEIILNGGLRQVAAACAHLPLLDGVMIGREAYENPIALRAFDAAIFGPLPPLGRIEIVEAMRAYIDREAEAGVPVKSITRHMLGLFNGLPGARAWRRHLSTHAISSKATSAVLLEAATHVDPALELAA
ncbi:tRNA-U16,U17-dihydrouridine synthase [Arboricoccus pini]|uniref:tRNA-dihydrouridine(20/20a) synthase n=1 Tax=Arboricoccus pini TaxID=1963835 RepID=A0A212RC39_9PROT|nr:tRNA dihydrouridine(20/20a) synthase DusA [Arboricoccus pini]SNB69755.1 tRNA-U16,U17-dihydrouridine synthase [Arboricoccus pini]